MKPIKLHDLLANTQTGATSAPEIDLAQFGLLQAAPIEGEHRCHKLTFDVDLGALRPIFH